VSGVVAQRLAISSLATPPAASSRPRAWTTLRCGNTDDLATASNSTRSTSDMTRAAAINRGTPHTSSPCYFNDAPLVPTVNVCRGPASQGRCSQRRGDHVLGVPNARSRNAASGGTGPRNRERFAVAAPAHIAQWRERAWQPVESARRRSSVAEIDDDRFRAVEEHLRHPGGALSIRCSVRSIGPCPMTCAASVAFPAEGAGPLTDRVIVELAPSRGGSRRASSGGRA
jgi:hypothetical protein